MRKQQSSLILFRIDFIKAGPSADQKAELEHAFVIASIVFKMRATHNQNTTEIQRKWSEAEASLTTYYTATKVVLAEIPMSFNFQRWMEVVQRMAVQ